MSNPIETLILGRLVAKATGNLAAGTGGITSSFTTPTGQVVNIVNGVIANVCGNGVGDVSPINTAYFSNLTEQIGAAKTCQQLQSAVDDSFGAIQDQINDINAQLALIAPILALLSAPAANPAAIVTWITSFINDFLTPYVIPFTTITAQLAALTSQVSSLTSAINAASGNIPGCHITIPPITGL